ncbi:MAG: excinuclease ABC subunit UvrA [Actinomycetota bacterium]|nr:excinuclease ABC subunit UvrA [Actinomycetota bacterium]MDD5600282.1 excinuclease ABC subunit UvrA [Actinomycetota bacterium]
MKEEIVIKGAREHNLKNINLNIPRNKFIVFTGVSGSGKSSLAFDTIYAEGQRRYVESLSSYARQFLGQMEKPDVDLIEGLSPAVSINQKGVSKNPRSTVGTITEIYDYLRVLYARIGIPYCYLCGRRITKQTVDQIVDRLMELPQDTKFQVLSPIIRGRKGEYVKVFENIKNSGYTRVRVDGNIYELDRDFDLKLDKNIKHNIEVVVDRLKMKPDIRNRLSEDIELSLKESSGIVYIQLLDSGEIFSFSENFSCVECGIDFEEITPRMFSFNSPYGACRECGGLGISKDIDPDLIVEYPELSIVDGAIPFINMGYSNYYSQLMRSLAREYDFDLSTPFKDLDDYAKRIILYGTDGGKVKVSYINHRGKPRHYYVKFEGLANNLSRRYLETESESQRIKIEKMIGTRPCSSCGGKRLRKESLAVKINSLSIADFCEKSIEEGIDWLKSIKLTEREKMIGERLIKEIIDRMEFLKDVGLGYLTLERKSSTLSGGESQRIRLATQIGSGLVGVLYILDEPSIGLHQRDNKKLIDALKRLRNLGNTIIVIEHDEETIRSSDFIVDIGPGAGIHGGEIVYSGNLEGVYNCENSITGKYLSGKKFIPIPAKRRSGNGKYIVIKGAREHNLKNIDVKIDLGKLIAVTGVSGSGKSTLVNEILYPSLSNLLMKTKYYAGKHDGILNYRNLDKVIVIDQSPIGRTPRSNPATYTGVFGYIRDLFSRTYDARIRGYKPGRFSFNVKGGRCEFCNGDGLIKIEMHFLPDIYVPCEVCKGKRFNRETLEIKYKDKNIDDVLNMTVEEAMAFFKNIPRIYKKLELINDVGLGYIKLGQPSTTLSGGEAQRIKLSKELSKKSTGNTLYLLDEPTTGLHFDDIKKLLAILERLVDAGNTVLVIEHNMEVIKTADYIIDLGPEGGERGGNIVACGTPEEVAENENSYTGKFIKMYANRTRREMVGEIV